MSRRRNEAERLRDNFNPEVVGTRRLTNLNAGDTIVPETVRPESPKVDNTVTEYLEERDSDIIIQGNLGEEDLENSLNKSNLLTSDDNLDEGVLDKNIEENLEETYLEEDSEIEEFLNDVVQKIESTDNNQPILSEDKSENLVGNNEIPTIMSKNNQDLEKLAEEYISAIKSSDADKQTEIVENLTIKDIKSLWAIIQPKIE